MLMTVPKKSINVLITDSLLSIKTSNVKKLFPKGNCKGTTPLINTTYILGCCVAIKLVTLGHVRPQITPPNGFK